MNFSLLESKEIQIAMDSSLLERKFKSTKVNSWPQVERRKLEDQQSNCFSASRNPQMPRLRNIKMATGSIDLHNIEGQFRSVKANSWPQVKRRNLEDQQNNCFSASRNSQIARLCNIKKATGSIDLHNIEEQAGAVLKENAYGDNITSELCPIMDCHVPEGLGLSLIASHDCMVEEIGRGDPVDLTFNPDGCYKPNEQADVATTSNDGIPHVSSGIEETVGDFCDPIIEVNMRDVPASPNFVTCEYSNEQNFQNALKLENNIGLENNESLCIGSIVPKSSSHMMEDGLFPHSLVHSSHDEEVESTGIDDTMPVFEGFVIDPPGAD